MNEIKINEYFESAYLTPGQTRDNFIFENCSHDFVLKAEKFLSRDSQDAKACNIVISRETEALLSATLDKCENDYQRKLLARDFFNSLFMLELIGDGEEAETLKEDVNFLLDGNIEEAKKIHAKAPMSFDIDERIKRMGRVELNVFLLETEDKFLQSAINNFISAREPYSIKIFATGALASYVDQNGTLIENPHDYMSRNVFDFITVEETSFEEGKEK